MDKKKELRGYVFSRQADGQLIPQRMQNMLIREYVESQGCKFLLSAVEYYMDGCYMMLDSLLEKIDDVDGLVFFSMTFLPQDKAKRAALYKRILGKGKELHFALENYAVKTNEEIEKLEEIIVIRQMTKSKEVEGQFIV